MPSFRPALLGSVWHDGVARQSGYKLANDAGEAATEGLINAYYNLESDVDLSEQDSVCRHGGSCSSGGYINWPLNEMQSTGFVTEDCFPTTNNENCGGKCADSSSKLWKINGYTQLSTDDHTLKYNIFKKGPITFGISSWWHFMNLVGYEPGGVG